MDDVSHLPFNSDFKPYPTLVQGPVSIAQLPMLCTIPCLKWGVTGYSALITTFTINRWIETREAAKQYNPIFPTCLHSMKISPLDLDHLISLNCIEIQCNPFGSSHHLQFQVGHPLIISQLIPTFKKMSISFYNYYYYHFLSIRSEID